MMLYKLSTINININVIIIIIITIVINYTSKYCHAATLYGSADLKQWKI